MQVIPSKVPEFLQFIILYEPVLEYMVCRALYKKITVKIASKFSL
jgi:hypothetical protein